MANEDEAGALWLKDGKNGKYMSGLVDLNGQKTRIVVFKNKYKQKESQPDYRILLAKKPQQQSGNDDFDDDIPI